MTVIVVRNWTWQSEFKSRRRQLEFHFVQILLGKETEQIGNNKLQVLSEIWNHVLFVLEKPGLCLDFGFYKRMSSCNLNV